MKRKQGFRRFCPLHLPLLLIVAFAIAPYIWTFITYLNPEEDLYLSEFRYFPEKPTGVNYIRLFNRIDF